MPADAPPSRAIDLEVEVPGTPDQVWAAIATGAGITAWMQPTEVEEREGGTFSYDMGTGTGRTCGTVTGWDPPRRFAQESRWELAGGSAGLLATEWTIQARSGATCVVRFDLAPPLASAGTQALDSDGLVNWYRTWQGPIGYDLSGLSITASRDVAFSYSLNHMTGTRTDGEHTDLWFRETVCLRKTSGTWKITHEHNSVPLYMDGTGKAATDLKP